LEGYELNVLDYLLKPISFNRFLMAVNKLKLQNPGEILFPPAPLAPSERLHIFINVNKKMVKVYIDEILYIESKKEYISIVTREKSFLTKFQLGEIEAQLANNDFLRIHRSFLVSKAKIDAFTATEIEIAGQQIPIGRSYKELVINQLGEKL
jgi:DNA-binding LytR/AlgR family response regulator